MTRTGTHNLGSEGFGEPDYRRDANQRRDERSTAGAFPIDRSGIHGVQRPRPRTAPGGYPSAGGGVSQIRPNLFGGTLFGNRECRIRGFQNDDLDCCLRLMLCGLAGSTACGDDLNDASDPHTTIESLRPSWRAWPVAGMWVAERSGWIQAIARVVVADGVADLRRVVGSPGSGGEIVASVARHALQQCEEVGFNRISISPDLTMAQTKSVLIPSGWDLTESNGWITAERTPEHRAGRATDPVITDECSLPKFKQIAI